MLAARRPPHVPPAGHLEAVPRIDAPHALRVDVGKQPVWSPRLEHGALRLKDERGAPRAAFVAEDGAVVAVLVIAPKGGPEPAEDDRAVGIAEYELPAVAEKLPRADDAPRVVPIRQAHALRVEGCGP